MRLLTIFSVLVFMVSNAANGLEIPLTVSEPIGAERTIEVASGGIPFAMGVCSDPEKFALYLDNKAVPVQVSPIVRYPDGSLHWALISIPVSLKGLGEQRFILKDKSENIEPANPVVVKESGDIVEISNGIVAFAVNKKSFNGFEWIKYNGKEIFKAAKAGLVANGQGGACAPILFEYSYRGSVLTTLNIKGTYGNAKTPTWSLRISLGAGESRIHLEHNLRNAEMGSVKAKIATPEFRLGMSGELTDGASGSAKKKKYGPAYGWKTFSGITDLKVFIRHGGHPFVKGALTHEAFVDDGEFVIDLAFIKGSPVTLDHGCHKLAEIDLAFGSTHNVDALAEPLHVLAPCSWYADNDGLGAGMGFGSLEDETLTYKAAGWTIADDTKKRPNRDADATIFNKKMDVHFTSECDQILGLTLGYIRTGQRGFLDDAVAWSRYWRTHYMYRTDEFTYGKDGLQGKMSKFGKDRTCAGGCHTYGVGIFSLAMITGNVDMFEGALELAEQSNGTHGLYSKVKPGDELGFWGSRGFSRDAHAIIRAYDITRTEELEKSVIRIVKIAWSAGDRDPRGFINHGSFSSSSKKKIEHHVASKKGFLSETGLIDAQKEGTIIEKKMLSNPKYGTWNLKHYGSWPTALLLMALNDAYRTLSESKNPEAQLAAEDAMDMVIVKARLFDCYLWNRIQKSVPSYAWLDFPIPGYDPTWNGGRWSEHRKRTADSWYTKWWPSPMAAGYKLTGDVRMKERMYDVLWWGLSRSFVNAPSVAEGVAPPYAYIDQSTKNDWMTTTALAFGVGARPKKDEIAPIAIVDFAIKTLGNGKVELSWTAPKDAGGKLGFYQVKWGEMPLDDYAIDGDYWRKNWKNGNVAVTYWNMAMNVLGEPKPQVAGSKEKMILTVPAGKTLYFSVRSFDDSHNRSDMSNVVSLDI